MSFYANLFKSGKLFILSGLSVIFLTSTGSGREVEKELKVMTFNVRYGTANDGPDHWRERREDLLNFLSRNPVDLLLLQEAVAMQVREIRQAMPGHTIVTRGRDDGRWHGEHVPILFCSQRFSLLAADTFWLSNTPEVPGSRHWGNQITRICTWVRLLERDDPTPITVFNLHLDHQSQPARMESIKLVLMLAEKEVAQGHRVIIGGDFNATEDNPLHQQLADHPVAWTNVHRVINPDDPTGTFNAFNLERAHGKPIDFIYTSAGFKAESCEIVLEKTNSGRWLSDHFPVRAFLSLERDNVSPRPTPPSP